MDSYSAITGIYMLLINIVIYFSLAFYLDQVFPNEWGSRKHPLFIFQWMWRKKKNPGSGADATNEDAQNRPCLVPDNVEEVENQFKV